MDKWECTCDGKNVSQGGCEHVCANYVCTCVCTSMCANMCTHVCTCMPHALAMALSPSVCTANAPHTHTQTYAPFHREEALTDGR